MLVFSCLSRLAQPRPRVRPAAPRHVRAACAGGGNRAEVQTSVENNRFEGLEEKSITRTRCCMLVESEGA